MSMSSRAHRSQHYFAAIAMAALIALPVAARAQDEPLAPRGPRPEVEFKVTIPPDDQRLARLKQEATRMVDSMSTFTQQMVDMLFSFGELGFQEVESSRYLMDVLEKNGFKVERGTAGIPTAWIATWTSPAGAKPVISLGSDIDDIPQASQKPGVGYYDPMIKGAPGHGEGHNSGQAVNITAAIAVKRLMERDRIPGTIHLWPGVAEELVGTKAYYVREGVFKNVDAVLFSHVGSSLAVSWGTTSGNGLISVQYDFRGTSSHAAGAPWRGRSALDAVELMDVAWNFRREHLRTQQRSHYVIKDGGDQPNVVPPTASVWYYFRETDYPRIMELFAIGDTIARAAAMMAGVKLDTVRILGSAWPGYFNKAIAMDMRQNIEAVGLPRWSEADQTLAKGIQRELKVPTAGLDTALRPMREPVREEEKRGGGSDDIGDVSWSVPTVTLNYPSNIPNLPGHNWANAIAMATPIAHKGATAGAKVQAMTMLDLYLKPSVLTQAWSFFRDVQTKEVKYTPLIRPQDRPAVWLNTETMAKYRPEMRKLYYDPTKYKTYLEQLGIKYPTVRATGEQVP
jgi:aminobenzoyl-glutamate utilization protein B